MMECTELSASFVVSPQPLHFGAFLEAIHSGIMLTDTIIIYTTDMARASKTSHTVN